MTEHETPFEALPDPATVPTVSVDQAARALGIARRTAYEAIRRGELPALRFGSRRIRVPTAALRRMLELEPADDAGQPATVEPA